MRDARAEMKTPTTWLFFFVVLSLLLALALPSTHYSERTGEEGEAAVIRKLSSALLSDGRENPTPQPQSHRKLQPKFAKPIPVAGAGGTTSRTASERKSAAAAAARQKKIDDKIQRHNAKKADQTQKATVKKSRFGDSTTSTNNGGKNAGGKPTAPVSQVAARNAHKHRWRNGAFGTGSTKKPPSPINLSGGRTSRSPSSGSGNGPRGSTTRGGTRRPQSISKTRGRGVTNPTSTGGAPPNIGKNGRKRPKKKVWRNSTRGSGRRNGRGHSKSFTPTFVPSMPVAARHRFRVQSARPTRLGRTGGGQTGVAGPSQPVRRSSGFRPSRPSSLRGASRRPSNSLRSPTPTSTSSGNSNSSTESEGSQPTRRPRRRSGTRTPTAAPTLVNATNAPQPPTRRTPRPSFVYGRRNCLLPPRFCTHRPTPRPSYNPAFPLPTHRPTFFNPPPPKGWVPRTSRPTARPTFTSRPTRTPTTLRQGIQKDNSGLGARHVAPQTIGYGNASNPALLNLPPAGSLSPPRSAQTAGASPSISLPNPARQGSINYQTLVKKYKLSAEQVKFFFIFLRYAQPTGRLHLSTGMQQMQIQLFNGLRNVSQSNTMQRLQNGFWISSLTNQMTNDPDGFNELASRAVRNIVWAGLARTGDPAFQQAAGQQMAGVNLGITGSLSILDGRINCGSVNVRSSDTTQLCRRLVVGSEEEKEMIREEGEAVVGYSQERGGGEWDGPLEAPQKDTQADTESVREEQEEELGGDRAVDAETAQLVEQFLALPLEQLRSQYLSIGIDADAFLPPAEEEVTQAVDTAEAEAEAEANPPPAESTTSDTDVDTAVVAAPAPSPRSLQSMPVFRFSRGAPTPRPTNIWEEAKPTARPSPAPTIIQQNTRILPLAGVTFYVTVTYCVQCIGAATNGRISFAGRIERIISAALQDRALVEEAIQEAAKSSLDPVIQQQLSEVDALTSTVTTPTLFAPLITGLRLAFAPTPRPTWTAPFTTGPTWTPTDSVFNQLAFPPSPIPTEQPSPVPGNPTARPSPRPTRPSPRPSSLPTPVPSAEPTTAAPTVPPTRMPIAIWLPPSLPTPNPTLTFATALPTKSVAAASSGSSSGGASSGSTTTIIVVSCLMPVVAVLVYLGYRSFNSAGKEEKRKKKWALQHMKRALEEGDSDPEDDDDEAKTNTLRHSIHEFYSQQAKQVKEAGFGYVGASFQPPAFKAPSPSGTSGASGQGGRIAGVQMRQMQRGSTQTTAGAPSTSGAGAGADMYGNGVSRQLPPVPPVAPSRNNYKFDPSRVADDDEGGTDSSGRSSGGSTGSNGSGINGGGNGGGGKSNVSAQEISAPALAPTSQHFQPYVSNLRKDRVSALARDPGRPGERGSTRPGFSARSQLRAGSVTPNAGSNLTSSSYY